MTDITQELEEFLLTPGMSGFEDDVRALVLKKVSEIEGAPKPKIDDMGNVIVSFGEDKQKVRHVLVVAHMDELGLLVTKINEDGSLCFRKMGGIDDRTLASRIVKIKTKKGFLTGVIGIKPPHLITDPAELTKTVLAKDLRIDLGTKSKKETQALGVEPFDTMVTKKDIDYLTNKIIVARGLDDRFGCVALLEILRNVAKKAEKLPLRVTFAWSVQEEIGLRGAHALAHRLRPDVVFAVDSGTATDGPDGIIPKDMAPFIMGKGPGLRLVDNQAVASPVLRNFIGQVAKKNRLPLQTFVTGGSTDAAAIQNVGCAVMPMSLPLRYTHSTVECISLDDLGNLIKLMTKVLEGIGGLK
jgi:putative aminopeptidase FrvX